MSCCGGPVEGTQQKIKAGMGVPATGHHGHKGHDDTGKHKRKYYSTGVVVVAELPDRQVRDRRQESIAEPDGVVAQGHGQVGTKDEKYPAQPHGNGRPLTGGKGFAHDQPRKQRQKYGVGILVSSSCTEAEGLDGVKEQVQGQGTYYTPENKQPEPSALLLQRPVPYAGADKYHPYHIPEENDLHRVKVAAEPLGQRAHYPKTHHGSQHVQDTLAGDIGR